MISYEPFWNTLKKKKVTQYQLIKYAGVSPALLDKFRKNENTSLRTIENLCKILRCSAKDIVEITDD